MTVTRKWNGTWIAGTSGWIDPGYDYRADAHKYTRPAPYLRKRFILKNAPHVGAVLHLACAGWHELYVNGQKADDRVLAPCISQADVHVNYLDYDLTRLLRAGENAITILLGNGAFNANTSDVWNFIHAPWRDYPRILCDLEVDGELLLKSDNSWKAADSPVIFDSWRSGETYDFSKEIASVFEASFDDSTWRNASPTRPPAGTPILEEMEPCRICEVFEPVEEQKLDETTIRYDFGVNTTGWVEMEIETTEELDEPMEVVLEFGERLYADGTADRDHISVFAKDGWEFQVGRAILAPGRRKFLWRPHFTYFGYRYVHLHCKELQKIRITRMQAQFIHNDFPSVGSFRSSSALLNRLQETTRRSLLTNFTGIPTDCPHREKNGWTGDHSLAMDTALWNYRTADATRNFLQILVDTQRPSGELAPIAPTPGWYWNCGPGWEYVLFEGAWELYRFCGDDRPMRQHYDAMRRYLEFTQMMEVDGLVEYGLGDWCALECSPVPSIRLTSSAWLCSMLERFQKIAHLTGHAEDIPSAKARAERIAAKLREEFLHKDGSVDNDSMSSLACLPYFHLCGTPQEETRIVRRLVERLRAQDHKAEFGIFGAKWVPRVLADHGFAEDALQILLQPECPGFAYMLANGATTLWESFDARNSLDHIMFGDLSAWCYEFLAGIRPTFEKPGFAAVELRPNVVPQLDFVEAEHDLPTGGTIKAGWKRQKDGSVCYRAELPENTLAVLSLPGKEPVELPPGVSERYL